MNQVITLGRYGDCINSLPLAKELSASGPVEYIISREFSSILDGVTYVNPVVLDVDYKELPAVLRQFPQAICCQSYKHPDKTRKTGSYQAEAWRIAGWLDRFGLPLVFDNRSTDREAALADKYGVTQDTILVAGGGCSSPFKKFNLWQAMHGVPNIVNLSEIRAERIYDVIGLIERAKLLLTIDSAPLHLSRSTNTPVVALLNDGWYGSVTHECCIPIRYADATPETIAEAILSCLDE